jgi:hypothetical protein
VTGRVAEILAAYPSAAAYTPAPII